MKSGGAEGNRTPGLIIANDALYQLSYGPTGGFFRAGGGFCQVGMWGYLIDVRT